MTEKVISTDYKISETFNKFFANSSKLENNPQ